VLDAETAYWDGQGRTRLRGSTSRWKNLQSWEHAANLVFSAYLQRSEGSKVDVLLGNENADS